MFYNLYTLKFKSIRETLKIASEVGIIVKPEQIIDVICQHKRDGTIIPIKIRLKDEDELYQEFVIKSYRVVYRPGQCMLPNEIPTMSHRWEFDCKIVVLSMERKIKLSYNAHEGLWRAGL